MPNEKGVTGTAKKAAAKRVVKPASTAPAAPKTKAPASPKAKPKTVSRLRKAARKTASIADAQDQVVAAKFAGGEAPVSKPARRPFPTLPASYGESHLLLLVRDPQTLFAAWDMAPSTIDTLKSRIGSRAFAVSTLTLRLFQSGGSTSVFHMAKKVRSRYLKVEGGPSFMAEIGFTSPAGRFEPVAQSGPCFVPMGAIVRAEPTPQTRRAMLGYREARALARRGLMASPPSGSARARREAMKPAAGTSGMAGSVAPRVLGGASDLYRR